MEKTARVFFALWPDDEVRRRLAKLAREFSILCDGRATRDNTLHMTLVFLGDVEESRLPLLAESAATVKAAPFSMNISRAGYWQHNRVAWAAPDTTPEGLSGLWQALSSQLGNPGFKLEQRAYSPHVTLVRKASQPLPVQEIEPFCWTVEEFVLVCSQLSPSGPDYRIIARWPLN